MSSNRRSVHFSVNDQTVVGTPSPSFSGSTLSSPDLASPFQLPPTLESPDESLHIDPWLTVPDQSRRFDFDLRRDPTHHLFAPAGPLTTEILQRPATTPPVESLKLRVHTGGLSKEFEIHPSRTRPHVTVRAVLRGIYAFLQTDAGSLDHSDYLVARPAYTNRQRVVQEKDGLEIQGMAYVDILGDAHYFTGLEWDEKREMWRLYVQNR